MNIRWDYFVNQYDTARFVSGADGRDNRHLQFVREFASVVSVLQDKTNNVIDLYRDILRAVEDLATCSYTSEAFSELLSKIQAAVRVRSAYPAPSSADLSQCHRSTGLIWKATQIWNIG